MVAVWFNLELSMASISSTGIGSGLDVSSIITQLVALEKQPLKALETKATNVSSQISAMAEIKSQFSTLAETATRLSSASAWTARTASSSNTAAADITATSAASATSFSLDVVRLAQKQSVSSAQVSASGLVGAGTMTFRLGTWTGASSDAGADNTAAAAAAALATTAANTAASALGTKNSTAATAAADLLLANTAASDIANFAVGTPSVANYSAAYSNWLASIVANDHVTPALISAQQTALDAVDTERGLLSPGDLAAVDGVATKVVLSTASTSKGAAVTAASASTAADAASVVAANAATAARPTFSAGSGSSDVSVTVLNTDTVATLAAKINSANAGVVATAFFDGTGDRLLLSSKTTGSASGFRVQVTDTTDSVNNDNSNLSRFAYDPGSSAYGMGSSGIPAKYGLNAQANINGLAVTSATNSLANSIPGVTIDLKAVTTSSATMSVSEDVTVAVKNVDEFVKAYNALNKNLADLTKYDAGTKTASLFQADSSILGLQNVLRGMLGSISTGSAYQRLSDIGMDRQLDGSIKVNYTKLSVAVNNGTELKKLFTTDNSNSQTNGFALKFAKLGNDLLAATGAVTSKSKALTEALTRNAKDQTKVNDRAAATEARLRKTYTALDTKMASLTALNSYVAQQVTTWNKSTN
jgi:flagellar hook-associated protein 2